MTAPALIGVDWGTSSFRAALIDREGRVLERKAAPSGILDVPRGGFETRLRELLRPWLDAHPGLPLVLSGMVTSRQGWVEVPYVSCPVTPERLADALAARCLEDGRTVRFVPGLSTRRLDGLPDVMRGEETQILGALTEAPGTRTLLLPGTHSKWVNVEAGCVQGFWTFMTGELFALLKTHSILGRLVEGEEWNEAGFERGVKVGLAGEGSAGASFARLFSARSLVLAGELGTNAVESYLSGLLIGSELREAAPVADAGAPVLVVGEPTLVARYARALALAGRVCALASPDAAARGQHRLALQAGLLEAEGA